jgi:hypothetical protein
MSFQSTEKRMVEGFAKLTLHEGITYYPLPDMEGSTAEIPLEPIASNRDKFIVNLKICLLWLIADSERHRRWTNIPIPLPDA